MRTSNGTEFALLAVLALLWGSSYLFIKFAVADIPPVTLIAARVTIAALVLTCVMWMQGGRLPRAAADWRRLALQSVLNATGAWTLLAWGQQYVDSALATVLNSTSPIFVFFITVFITRHEAVTGWRLAGACLGLGGVVLIVGIDALAGIGTSVMGQLAALAGALLYAAAAIHGKRFAHLSPTETAAGTMICASVCLVPASLVVDAPWTLRPGAEAVMATLALSVLCTAAALMLYFRLVRTLGSMGVASQAYLRTGVGVLLGVVIGGETIGPIIGLGLIAAVAGVVLINTTPARRAG